MSNLEHVPTLEELAKAGHARVITRNAKGVLTEAVPDATGQQMIYDAMARNAEQAKLAAIAGRCGRTIPGGHFCALQPHGSDRHRWVDAEGAHHYWVGA